jgi:hypothetical protein
LSCGRASPLCARVSAITGRQVARGSSDTLDQLEQFVDSIAVVSGELD